MIVNGIRPRTLRTRLALVGLGAIAAAGALTMPGARADGVISTAEALYIDQFHEAVCKTLDRYPTEGGVDGVLLGVIQDGWDGDSAADIVNASVSIYCDDHWPLLVAVGDRARRGAVSQVVKS